MKPTSRISVLVRTVRAVVQRHPRAVDAGLAGLVAVLSGSAVTSAGGGVAGSLWFAVLHLPLVWRRRAPVVVFWTVCGLVVVGAAFSLARVDRGLYPEAIVMVALYAVARYRPRRHLWPAVAAIEIAMVVLLLPAGRWATLALATSVTAATVLLGITISTRRAYLAELEERARRLERERDQQAQLAVAAERARIAREMHDIVAHNLAVMVALADGAALTATVTPQRAADTMQKVSATGRQALGEMRRLLGLLRDGAAPGEDPAPSSSATRTPQPGFTDLDRLVDQVRAAGLRVALTTDGVPGAWGPGAGLAVYRIVQEALTNTLKHAGPHANAHVRLHYTADAVELEVADDGAHPLAPSAVGGHGLAGMIERATSYGGHVEAGPRPGDTGWQVRARLCFDDNLNDKLDGRAAQ
jgi:signal transduction histidine kinase